MPAVHAQTAQYARQGRIDPSANLARNPTHFFHGTRDTTVVTPVADDLAAYYRHYGVPLTYRNARAAGHGWISPLGPVPCADTAAPYVNHCAGYDAEADLLRVMLGSVAAPDTGAPRGTLRTFAQDPYAVPPAPGDGDYLGPDDTDHATKLGPQMRTVMNEVAALGG